MRTSMSVTTLDSSRLLDMLDKYVRQIAYKSGGNMQI